jgi:hypothetical protein
MVNAHFGLSFTEKQIMHAKTNYGLRGGKEHISFPIFSERLRHGRIIIKVSMIGNYYTKWKEKHRYIWEQAHGKIPEGMIIIFLDKNRQNCDLENLAMVSRAEEIFLKQYGLYSNNREETLAGIAIVKHSVAIHNQLEKMLGTKKHKLFNQTRYDRRRRESKKRLQIPSLTKDGPACGLEGE